MFADSPDRLQAAAAYLAMLTAAVRHAVAGGLALN